VALHNGTINNIVNKINAIFHVVLYWGKVEAEFFFFIFWWCERKQDRERRAPESRDAGLYFRSCQLPRLGEGSRDIRGDGVRECGGVEGN